MNTRLAVFGDSFATPSRYFGGYPHDLAKLLNMNIDLYAKAGTSIWWSYKNFIQNYKKYSHVVFVYTFAHRWPVLPDYLENLSWIIDKDCMDKALILSSSEQEEMQKLLEIHRYIFDEDFNNFIWKTIFKNVNQICRDNKIKLFNILPFESESLKLSILLDKNTNEYYNVKGSILDLNNCYGSCLTHLVELSSFELGEDEKFPRLDYIRKVNDIRGCHLNISNNKAIAEIIAEEFNKDKTSIIDARFNEKMSFDPNEILNMIEEYENIKRC